MWLKKFRLSKNQSSVGQQHHVAVMLFGVPLWEHRMLAVPAVYKCAVMSVFGLPLPPPKKDTNVAVLSAAPTPPPLFHSVSIGFGRYLGWYM